MIDILNFYTHIDNNCISPVDDLVVEVLFKSQQLAVFNIGYDPVVYGVDAVVFNIKFELDNKNDCTLTISIDNAIYIRSCNNESEPMQNFIRSYLPHTFTGFTFNRYLYACCKVITGISTNVIDNFFYIN